MIFLGNEYSRRETIFIFLLLVLVLGYFASLYAFQEDLKEYKDAYTECIKAYNYAERGMLPTNLSLGNISLGVINGNIK